MSDFLANLAARTADREPALRPRLPGLFEPALAPLDLQPAAPAPSAAWPQPPSMPAIAAPDQPGAPVPPAASPRLPDRFVSRSDTAPAAPALAERQPAPGPLAAAGQPTLAAEPPAGAPPNFSPPAQAASAQVWERPTLPGAPTPARPGAPQPAARLAALAPAAAQPPQAPRPEPQAPAAASAPAPSIQITIGRIEVRATMPAQPAQRQRTTPAPISLDDYLRQRRGGGQP